jgi:hypothetical protein
MRIKPIAILFVLAAGCLFAQREASSKSGADHAKPEVAVVLRQGPERLWHHRGDQLDVTYGDERLIRIELQQASDYEVPLTLTLSPHGRILYWGEYFDNPALGTRETTYTLLRCNGELVQAFKTVMFAGFDLGSEDKGVIILALPQEGFQYWTLRKIDDRNATLTRKVDPCYVGLLKNGGKVKDAGVWGSAAMNCILDCALFYKDGYDNSRQFQVNLPWPDVNPPGTGFRPEK